MWTAVMTAMQWRKSRMRNKRFLQKVFSTGTPHCAVACALVAVFIALIGLWAGFWRALLFAAVVTIGAFIGGVKDKKRLFQRFFVKDSNMY